MAKCIMIQGTMSNAGKSLLCAALCRIFTQDGYKVAPFKSQNMALNSYVTNEGLEMGRAQVVQAQAAKKEPSVLMNPILLKPTSDVGSQVIVNGKAFETMKATKYYEYKHKLIPDILKAYNTLSKENDIIVIEGAGSPAEINLKQDDIVNMGLANMVDAPVLLVGDIDRGGVFAQLYGTVELLDKNEKDRIKGLIINKFRGDEKILESGVKMIEEMTGVPCVGVVPYVNVDIEDEDSLSNSLSNGEQKEIDIAVIMLPRISNFTDFDTFSRFDNVSLRYVKNCKELKNPDCIILPGTKSTVSDLLWLRESGLETLVKKHASRKKPVIGICGGLQMLGNTIIDKVEGGSIKEIAGLGLLDVNTIFHEEKTLRQVNGRISGISGDFCDFNGMEYEGYEIHMGQSGEFNGVIQSGNVLATYVHGIFDNGLDEALVKVLCKQKGLEVEANKQFDRVAYKEQQFDKLAAYVRNAVDMEKIYEIMGLVRK